jgi:hypothetical protein
VPRAPSTTEADPPDSLAEVLRALEFENALQPEDPRYVETAEARGSPGVQRRFERKLGWYNGRFLPPGAKHVLFFGHVGAGKSTELRRYARELSNTGHVHVVEVDVTTVLDLNNLQFPDALLAMAQRLLESLVGLQPAITVDPACLRPLQSWFSERVQQVVDAKELAAELKTEASVAGGIPFVAKLLAKFSASFKANVTYKETLRTEIRNTFTQLAGLFNALLAKIEEALTHARGKDVRVLFLLDGTDKLKGEDTKRFFVEDAQQLLEIQALVVYTAPISMKYQGDLVGQLDADLILPILKLTDASGAPNAAGQKAMRDLLLHRVAASAFATEAQITALVDASGGHPRELLRLLKYCCELADQSTIDAATVERAVAQLASEYRRILEPKDYDVLAAAAGPGAPAGNDERVRRLLFNLSLLEYNDGSWRRPHPVVRGLDGFTRAVAQLAGG